MTTFGAMKTAIARRLLDADNTAVTLVEIGEAINDAVSFWKKKRFWFNETSADLTIASGDSTVTLPADYLMEIPRNAITITDGGSTYQVKKVSPSFFDGIAGDEATGRPVVYTSRDGALEFYPEANQAYTGKLYYMKDYNDFTTAGAQDSLDNDFLVEAPGLIQNHALANLHGELRQDEKMEDRYTSRTNMEYDNLRARTNRILRTGTLTVEQ